MPNRPAKYGALGTGRVRLRGYSSRGSACSRGYDGTWKALREAKLQQDPWCAHCLAQDKHTPASEVDHIRPFKGKGDPLRLDWRNLQSLCKPCHSRKTAKDKQSGATDRPATMIDDRPAPNLKTTSGSPTGGGGVQSGAFS